MKLNPDCIRDILFFLEDHLTLSANLNFEPITYMALYEQLGFSKGELVNTLIVLDEAEFIRIRTDYSSEGLDFLDVYRITYGGYQFLETIRPEPVWKKTKSIFSAIGSFSIDLISQIATNILTELINGQLSP